MATLFNGDNSDSDGESELKINKDYANIYNNFREKEELHKLKARYGDDAVDLKDESDTSSSEDDDDDEIIQDPQFEKEFLITLACLKNEDPCIYDEKTKFFSDVTKAGTSEDIESEKKEKKSKKEKSLFLRDYERKIMTERNGRYSSSEDEDDTEQKAKSVTITYTEEQKQIKDSFKHALKDDDEDEDIDFLKIKKKTDEEKHKEDDLYKEWLKGREVKINSQDQEILKPLRNFWNNPNLDKNEKFLRDYILNNKYMDSASYNADLDYNHVIHDSDENLSEDEKTIQKQEEFERKYNFRFEEPDQEFIKRYPRTMENSMRKKDTRRAQKRIEVKQRKEEEKQRKNEELKQLKALKRKEIEEKIEKLKEITGNNDMHFDNVDFDADFDPNEHDKKMKELFNDEYYADYTADEDKKPEFPDVDEELDIERTWDQYDPSANKIKEEELHCEDPDFNMDADYDESQNFQADLENTKKKKRRRRSKFAELLTKEKPKFDPKQYPSYEEYFDQYYSLDYEDMIGDLPCRFKYRKVMPNDYGLTVDEILTADDRELNKWCSLRQALKHKSEHVEQQELRMYKQKGKNEAFKRKVLRSLYVDPEEEEKQEKSESVDEQPAGKKHRRKKKSKAHSHYAKSTVATDIIPKEENINIMKSDMQNNSCDSKNDEKQGEDLEGKIVMNKRKRKNKLKTADDGSVPKKIKINDAENENSHLNDVKIKIEKDVQIEKDKKKINDTKIKNKNEMPSVEKYTISKKKKKDFKLNKGRKVGKHRQNDVDSMMSLDAERLKTYGINAKKFKNKLKYGNKKF